MMRQKLPLFLLPYTTGRIKPLPYSTCLNPIYESIFHLVVPSTPLSTHIIRIHPLAMFPPASLSLFLSFSLSLFLSFSLSLFLSFSLSPSLVPLYSLSHSCFQRMAHNTGFFSHVFPCSWPLLPGKDRLRSDCAISGESCNFVGSCYVFPAMK